MSTTSVPAQSILNVAAYKFVALSDLPDLRATLLAALKSLGLKGTILLSPEGINLFLAGEPDAVRAMIDRLHSFPEFADLEFKESLSDHQPFNRALVRLKREIIAFGVDGIDPAHRTSPKLPAQQLREWLDQGREVTLLDVRNDYEVALGTFENATPIGVDHFRDFPDAVAKLPEEAKDRPLVMFCTGGIRCEKAGPLMQREGFKEVYQLEGGILKYFEEVGGAHYQGDCFVFDQRVAVDPNLEETDTELCYACQATLTLEEQQSPHYVPSVSCPHCYKPEDQQIVDQCQKRNRAILAATDPLPGSTPQDNIRPICVSEKCDGLALIDLLDRAHPHVGRDVWQARCDAGLLRLEGEPVDGQQIVAAGQRYQHVIPAEIEPDVNPAIEILYEDAAIVVANKPAPLPMHPSGRFNRNTLTSILKTVYHPEQLRIAHRLDANTSGVVVLSRSKAAARQIQPQFESGKVKKTYLARVHGHPAEDSFECNAAISAVPTQAGLRTIDEAGQASATRFEVVKRLADGTTLLQVTPLTGRTNQIRVHLWHLGFPIVGDPAYLTDGKLGETQTLAVDAPTMCLHAWKLQFSPAGNDETVEMTAPQPAWAN
ncbi:sulfurtransferase [Rosistilla oblonga]|uniref:sulfurtransferase n=1 Tax=Rosistilla oblonga TaxID=2527990 RepID=UPI003A97DC17